MGKVKFLKMMTMESSLAGERARTPCQEPRQDYIKYYTSYQNCHARWPTVECRGTAFQSAAAKEVTGG